MMKKKFFASLCVGLLFFVPVLLYAGPVIKNDGIGAVVRTVPLALIGSRYGNKDRTRQYRAEAPVFNDTILLPMTMPEFSARRSGPNCYLAWKCVREEYSHPFSVERSTDGKTFIEAGITPPGPNIGMQQYNFTDYGAANLGVRTVFYRLRQLDAEGKSEYTHVLAVTVGHTGSPVNFFPNPARDRASLLVHVSQEEKLDWILTDPSGKTLKRGQSLVSPGASRVNIDLKGLISGIYFLQLKSNSVDSHLPLVKL